MIKTIAGIMVAVISLAGGAFGQERVGAEMAADTTAVTAGKPFMVGLHLTVADGWHVYWTNPGDAGAATTFKITAPPGFVVGPVQYPVPEKLPQPGGLTIYAYEKELVLTAEITPPADLKGMRGVRISGAAGWCVCADVCILGKKKLELSLPVGAGEAANRELFEAWERRMPVAFDQAFDKKEISTTGDIRTIGFHWRKSVPAGQLQWLAGTADDLNVLATGIRSADGWTSVDLKIDSVQGISPTSSTISGVLAYYVPGKPACGVGVTIDRTALKLPAGK